MSPTFTSRLGVTVSAICLTAAAGCMDMSMDPPSTTPIPAITTDAVLVVNGGDPSISVIDPSSSSVVGTIRIENGEFPHHISLSPNRALLAVAIPGMDLSAGHEGVGTGGVGGHEEMMAAVMVLDATTGKTIVARRLEAMNHNAIFSPDGTEVWTSQMMMSMRGTVLVLDATTLETKQTITVGDMPAEITFDRNGMRAFVANGMSHDVTVIDVVTKTVAMTIPVCDGPVGAWAGIDGVMYTDCEAGESLAAIDAQSLAEVRRYALGFMPGMAGTPPGTAGELWVTNAEDGRVVFYNTSTGSSTGELATGAGAHGIGFSADGLTAFVTNQAANNLSAIDVAAKTIRATHPVGQKPNGLVFRAR